MYFCNFIKFEFEKTSSYHQILLATFPTTGKVNFYLLTKKFFQSLKFQIPESFKESFYFYEKIIKNTYIFKIFSIETKLVSDSFCTENIIVNNDQDGVIPYSCLSFNDPMIGEILPKYDAVYLESTWDNVHKVPFPKELSSGIRIIKGFILPDGSYSCYDSPFFEFEIRSEILAQIIRMLEKDGFCNIDISNICIGLYKIILEGIHSRQLLIVVDSLTKLPQVQISYVGNNIRIKISDDLAKTLDGVEVMIWYYEDDKSKHYLRLGSIINGDKSLEEVRLRLK